MAARLFNDRYPCPICERFHSLRDWTKFLVLPIPVKRQKVVALKLCQNCMAKSRHLLSCHSDPTHCWFPMGELRIQIDPNLALSCVTVEGADRLRCKVRQGFTKIQLQYRREDRPNVELRCAGNDFLLQDVCDADQWWWRQYSVYMVLGADWAHKVFKGPAVVKTGQGFLQATIFGTAYFGEGQPVKSSIVRRR